MPIRTALSSRKTAAGENRAQGMTAAPLLIFFAGLAGSLHCVGMCGGFACAVGGDARGPLASLARQGLYNLGRVGSYVFIGALAGHVGAFVVEVCGDQLGIAAQRALALLAGALMVFIGLQFAGLLRHAAPRWPGRLGEVFARTLSPLLRAPGSAAPLVLGVLNGWLPCPLVYAFAAEAAASGDAASGALVMAWFGLGTFPALLVMGALGIAARRRDGWLVLRRTRRGAPALDVRVWSVRLGAVFLVGLGMLTASRGLWPMHAAMH
jgi:uncharacterized protein